MRRIIKMLALIVAGGLLLTGCGKKEPTVSSEVTSESYTEIEEDLEMEQRDLEDLLLFSDANAMLVEDDTILVENVTPYSGACMESGNPEDVSDVYAFRITNLGGQTIQTAELIFATEQQELFFCVEMLPAGQTTTVVEAVNAPATEELVYYLEGNVSYLDSSLENADCIEVSGSDGTVTVKNVTDELLPLVRVFYRTADENGNILGGTCFSFVADGIEPGAEVTVEAENWTENSIISTVLLVQE